MEHDRKNTRLVSGIPSSLRATRKYAVLGVRTCSCELHEFGILWAVR